MYYELVPFIFMGLSATLLAAPPSSQIRVNAADNGGLRGDRQVPWGGWEGLGYWNQQRFPNWRQWMPFGPMAGQGWNNWNRWQGPGNIMNPWRWPATRPGPWNQPCRSSSWWSLSWLSCWWNRRY